ncbi:hypothetical protein [Gloeocapsopsis dulcis]|uniref:Uncharacterized protein n=1 Tax=Gloeocapsopsis dulcis AAB1 = 1H9 TaxID=1433147 RepID=A0A6N8FVQ2_9CHRO|nr:hypothetical protein [Gloeocapsopsis dulcis]MUL36026.1 hypothetical protein [Gloeocapsopsis dulcis AAB1 = 1H9]WNN88279.1 hypothetical protein P0S91_18570 [Gloeocapsopsis dulcis]
MSQDNQQAELQTIVNAIRTLAENCQGNNIALLALLRQLEGLHQEIRDGLFQASLPDNRQALYTLLRDIESQGGWPYIERMRLQALLVNVEAAHRDNHNADKKKISEGATTPESHNGEATVMKD